MNSKPQPPAPVGIWYTRTDYIDDPDNIGREEMTLVAIAPRGHVSDQVATMIYDWKCKTTAELGDDPRYVVVAQHPIEGKWQVTADDMMDEPNTATILDALADYLSRVTGGCWEVTPFGGGGSQLEAVGIGSRGQSATLTVTDGCNQPPILGWDDEAVVSFHDEDDDGVVGFVDNRGEPLSPVQIVTEVLRAVEEIGFTFTV